MLAILIDRKGFVKHQEIPGHIPPPEYRYPIWTPRQYNDEEELLKPGMATSSTLLFRRGPKLYDGVYEYHEA